MGTLKTIVAGGIIAGAGIGLRIISDVIFSTFGATSNPIIDYQLLIDLTSTVLIGIGVLVTGIGMVQELYRMMAQEEPETGPRDGPADRPPEQQRRDDRRQPQRDRSR